MIRPARIQDVPRLLELGQAMHDESPRFSRLRFDEPTLRTTLQNLLAAHRTFVWVAEVDGVVVGGLVAILAQHWASTDYLATDLALFMAPEARGSMAAVRLVKRYVEWAIDSGARIVQMGVTTGVQTEQTAALLERLGLTRCGVILEVDDVHRN